jgi:hypothetical protein
VRWTAQAVDVTLSPRDLAALHVSVLGDQSIGVGTGVALHCLAASADLRIPFAATPATFEIRALQVDAGRSILASLVTGQVTQSAATLAAVKVTVSPPFPAPFDADLAFTAAVASTPAFPVADPSAATVAAWRSKGGRVTIPGAELRWGPLHATGSGTGELDARLQPAGQAALNVEGAPALLDAAAQEGMLQPGPAAAMRGVLALLALAGPGPARIPISLGNGTLAVASFPLARLAPVVW